MTQLDSNVEEVTLQEIQLRKAFRSTQNFDQQVLTSSPIKFKLQPIHYTISLLLGKASKKMFLIMWLHQVVSRESMPKSMLEQYLACDKPPPLDKLNPYRWNILPCFLTKFCHKCATDACLFWLSTSQGGRQRWTEVLHGCKLFLRPVALRNAAVHREG